MNDRFDTNTVLSRFFLHTVPGGKMPLFYNFNGRSRQQTIQSTLVISNLKGPSETLRDIRTSPYQIFRIEENTNRTTKFNK